MSISPEDIELLNKINEQLQSGKSLRQTASDMNISYDTLYSRIQRLGYELETDRRLVPKKRSPDLDATP